MTIKLDQLTSFEPLPSPGFAGWLAEMNVSIGFGRRDSIVLVGRSRNDELRVDSADFGNIGGMAVDGDSMWLSTGFQMWRFENALLDGAENDDGVDRFFIPQFGATTGNLVIEDIAIGEDKQPVFTSFRFACIAQLSEELSFTPLWMPAWVSRLAPDFRSPITGLAMRDGKPGFATAIANTDKSNAWKKNRASSGLIVDLSEDRVIADSLSMPYTPRWFRDRLWFTEAGQGRLNTVNATTGEVETIVELPTFLRGLSFIDRYAVVAGSGSRSDELLDGLPIGERLDAAGQRSELGIWVIDTDTGEVVHRLGIEGTGRECLSVVAFEGARRVGIINPNSPRVQNFVTYDRDWDPT
jgi:uncharacterized protein (TIGR03032 family)